MNRLSQCLIATGLVSHVHAASYFDDFNSYSSNTPVGSIAGWTLEGSSDPTAAIIRTSPFPFPQTSSGRAIHLGFQEIDTNSAYLYRSPGVSLVGNPGGYTEFQAVFTVQDSEDLGGGVGVPRDQFSFTFRGASNENLLTITLSPTAQVGDPGLPPNRIDQFSWTSDFAAGNSNIGSLSEGQWSTLNVTFTPSPGGDVAFSAKFQNVEFAAGILVGAGSQTLGEYGMVWNPLNPSNEGANVLIVDDINLVAIPEPSSAILLGVAGLGLALRRRRA